MPANKTEAGSEINQRQQFSLIDLLVCMTAIAIYMACYVGFGRDGLALAALLVPALCTPFWVKGTTLHKMRMTISTILLVFGVTWWVLFPKTWDLLREDMFASTLFGVGLIAGGLLIRREPFMWMLLCTWLLWSLLWNLAMFNSLHTLRGLLSN